MPRSVSAILALCAIGLLAATVCGSTYWQGWMIAAGLAVSFVSLLLSL